MSRTFAIGQVIGEVIYIRPSTIGLEYSAMISLCGPVHQDYGIISPTTSTPKTAKIIATNSDTALLRKIGRVSRARALQRSRVTNIQWCCLMTLKMVLALLATTSDCFAAISRVNSSIEARPIVRPDMNPEMAKHVNVTVMSTYHSGLHGS